MKTTLSLACLLYFKTFIIAINATNKETEQFQSLLYEKYIGTIVITLINKFKLQIFLMYLNNSKRSKDLENNITSWKLCYMYPVKMSKF